MNRHLNAFRAYSVPERHEDQLTRAAMLILRAVPLARDTLLARIDAPPIAQLPECQFDMQTRHVFEELDAPALPDGEEPEQRVELVSVYLSPDEIDFAGAQVEDRPEREQRLDGVLRFGDRLVIAIESKIVGGPPTDQATHIRLRGVEAKARVKGLSWHVLLEDWWDLLERGQLGPAETVLMNDLVDFTEEHFPHLLPFNTLRRAGENESRRQRRLMALLRSAAQGAEGVRGRGSTGAEVLLDPHESTQRIALEAIDGDLLLRSWPAELQPQARSFYRSDRPDRLLELTSSDSEKWSLAPNPHLGFWLAKSPLYTHCELDAAVYIEQWNGDDYDWLHGFGAEEVRGELWPWFKERGYASAADDAGLEQFIESMGKKPALVRPGMEVRRRWSWADATELDERKQLVGEVAEAIAQLLDALRETLPQHHTEG